MPKKAAKKKIFKAVKKKIDDKEWIMIRWKGYDKKQVKAFLVDLNEYIKLYQEEEESAMIIPDDQSEV